MVCIVPPLGAFLLKWRLTPKSQSRSSGGCCTERMQFSGFTSRKTMRREWQKARAESTWEQRTDEGAVP